MLMVTLNGNERIAFLSEMFATLHSIFLINRKIIYLGKMFALKSLVFRERNKAKRFAKQLASVVYPNKAHSRNIRT